MEVILIHLLTVVALLQCASVSAVKVSIRGERMQSFSNGSLMTIFPHLSPQEYFSSNYGGNKRIYFSSDSRGRSWIFFWNLSHSHLWELDSKNKTYKKVWSSSNGLNSPNEPFSTTVNLENYFEGYQTAQRLPSEMNGLSEIYNSSENSSKNSTDGRIFTTERSRAKLVISNELKKRTGKTETNRENQIQSADKLKTSLENEWTSAAFLCAEINDDGIFFSVKKKNVRQTWRFDKGLCKWEKIAQDSNSHYGRVVYYSCQSKSFQIIFISEKKVKKRETNSTISKYLVWTLTKEGIWTSLELNWEKPQSSLGRESLAKLATNFMSDNLSLLVRTKDSHYEIVSVSGNTGDASVIFQFNITSAIKAAILDNNERLILLFEDSGCSIVRIYSLKEDYDIQEERICPSLDSKLSIYKLQNTIFLNESISFGINQNDSVTPHFDKIYSISVTIKNLALNFYHLLSRDLTLESFDTNKNLKQNESKINHSSSSKHSNEEKNEEKLFVPHINNHWIDERRREANKKHTNILLSLPPNSTHLFDGSETADSVLFFSLSLSIFAFVGIVIFVRRCVRCPPPPVANERPFDVMLKTPSSISTLYNRSVPDVSSHPYILKQEGNSPSLISNAEIITPDTPFRSYILPRNYSSQIFFPFTQSPNSCENSPRTKFFPADEIISNNSNAGVASDTFDYHTNDEVKNLSGVQTNNVKNYDGDQLQSICLNLRTPDVPASLFCSVETIDSYRTSPTRDRDFHLSL